MNKMSISYSFVFIILCIVALLLIVYFIYDNNSNNINNIKYINTVDTNKEGFTSGFRQMFRPSIRNVRLFGEKYYNLIKKNTTLFFRKFGVI